MNPIIALINVILNMLSLALIIWIIMGWLIEFRILNRTQPLVWRINDALTRLFEPMLQHIRKITPNLGTVDISPVILWLAIFFVQYTINYLFA